jgi:hypothetical protein
MLRFIKTNQQRLRPASNLSKQAWFKHYEVQKGMEVITSSQVYKIPHHQILRRFEEVVYQIRGGNQTVFT